MSLTINEFPDGSGPEGIVSGLDCNLWFTGNGSSFAGNNKVGQINPTTHAIVDFQLPFGSGSPAGITVGPDGNLWFTLELGNGIGQINPTTHAVVEFPTPTAGATPLGITTGPDGNLWFTEPFGTSSHGGQIGRINPTTHVITEFPLPTAGSSPAFITAGPDGNLWFTEEKGDKIGQINPTTHVITEFPLPTANSDPQGITLGPDGNLWFTELTGKIGLINPTSHAIAEFPTPTAASILELITPGPDGNLWFAESSGNKIGQINPMTHAVAEFPVPSAGSLPTGIASGPDGNVWFTELFGNKIGQVVLKAPATAPDLALTGTGPGSVTLGDNVTYALTVTNNGTADATGVKVTDTLPADVTFVSATDGVTPVNGVVTFLTPSLAAGLSATFTIVVKPGAAGTLRNLASASGNETDPTPADNIATQTTTVATVAASADLAVSGDAPGSVTLGNNVTYTLTVTNGGPSRATGVTLTDTLPAGVTFVSATAGVTPVDGVLTFQIANLDVGASSSFTLVVTPGDAITLNNKASAGGDQSDPTPGDNTITQVTMVTEPAAVDGPTVTSLQRFGFHALPTTLVLKFDKTLDATRAQNPENYQIAALGGARGRIRITSATYDPTTRTVTLRPAHRLNLHHLFRLTVVGTGPSGVTDVSGNRLDGQNAPGVSGSNFVTIVSAADLVLTTTNPALLRAYKKILCDQRAWEQRLGAAGELGTSAAS